MSEKRITVMELYVDNDVELQDGELDEVPVCTEGCKGFYYTPLHTAPPEEVHQWWVEQKEKWGKQHRENRMKNTTYEMQADGALTILDDFKMELIKAIGYDISTHTIIERNQDELQDAD